MVEASPHQQSQWSSFIICVALVSPTSFNLGYTAIKLLFHGKFCLESDLLLQEEAVGNAFSSGQQAWLLLFVCLLSPCGGPTCCLFPPAAFKTPHSSFHSWFISCLGVQLCLPLLGVCWAFWVCRFVSFIMLGTFWAIVSLNPLSHSLSLPLEFRGVCYSQATDALLRWSSSLFPPPSLIWPSSLLKSALEWFRKVFR